MSGHTDADGAPLAAGYYEFDAEGKMILGDAPVTPDTPDTPVTPPASEEEVKHGIIRGSLYINGVKQTAYKLVEFEGAYYFINDGHKIAVSCKIFLGSQFVAGHTDNDGAPLAVGYYEFGADGKMILD